MSEDLNSSDSKKNTTEQSSIISNFWKLIVQNQHTIYAFIIGILNSLIVVSIISPLFYADRLGFLNPRTWTVSTFAIQLFITFAIVLYKNVPNRQRFYIWFNSNFLSLFTFAFISRLNFTSIDIAGIQINTGSVIVLLLLLVFLVNQNIFGEFQRKTSLLVSQVFLFVLQLYSFLQLLYVDKTFLRNFSLSWISSVFSLGPLFWIFLTSLTISLATVANLKLNSLKKDLIFIGVVFILCFQVLFLIQNLIEMTYWYRALIFIVFWDFVYGPLQIVAREEDDPKFNAKFNASVVYHAILIAAIFIANSLT